MTEKAADTDICIMLKNTRPCILNNVYKCMESCSCGVKAVKTVLKYFWMLF